MTVNIVKRALVISTVFTAFAGSAVLLAPSAEAASPARTAIKFAMDQRGDRYSQVNPQGPNHWDCSGLVRASWKKAGKSLPRVAQAQFDSSKTRPIHARDRKPGDLIFFGGRNSIYHVGLYYGWKYKGRSGGWILHSPRPGGVVRVEKLWTKAVRYERVK